MTRPTTAHSSDISIFEIGLVALFAISFVLSDQSLKEIWMNHIIIGFITWAIGFCCHSNFKHCDETTKYEEVLVPLILLGLGLISIFVLTLWFLLNVGGLTSVLGALIWAGTATIVATGLVLSG